MNADVEQMLKFSRKQGAQRRYKMLAKHGNETLSAVTPHNLSIGPSQEGASGSAAEPYDFSSLTDAQKHVLTFQGWDVGDRKQPSKATVRKLIERGLLVARERKFSGGLIVTEYDVPLAVHMAWCAHCCSDQEAAK